MISTLVTIKITKITSHNQLVYIIKERLRQRHKKKHVEFVRDSSVMGHKTRGEYFSRAWVLRRGLLKGGGI